MPKAPTLQQVAALSGVSRSTVSRVINASPKVTPGAVAAVEQAIAELGYVPNRAARLLALRRSFSVALVVPENTARFFADPYIGAVVQGVATQLSTSDYTLTLLIAAESDPEKTRRYLAAGNVDGAIVLSHHADDRSYLDLAADLPVVFAGRPMSTEGDAARYVDVDNAAAAHAVTDLLVAAGRTRIATIAGPQDMAAGRDRLAGWRAAVRAAGLSDARVAAADFTAEGGAAAMRALLAAGPVDGVFVASAQMASGALAVLAEAGLTVPAEVGIVAIDEDWFARSGGLTTVEQPTVELGAAVAELLLDAIDGTAEPGPRLLPTRIIRRGSEGPVTVGA